MSKDIKLEVEMIPSSNFYNNVRSAVTPYRWDILRKECYERAGNRCEICGETGKEQGYKHDQEAHERWSFDYTTNTQKLEGLISLCVRCHLCKHIGRAFAVGKQAEVFMHLEKVNNWSHKDIVTYLAHVFTEHYSRSSEVWKLDMSILYDEYGLDSKVILKEGPAKKTTYHYKKAKKKQKAKKSTNQKPKKSH